jgi:hypothetical protein
VKLDNNNKGCVSDYCGLAIYILKGYLKAKKKKRRIYGNSNILPCKNIIFQKKNPSKKKKPNSFKMS